VTILVFCDFQSPFCGRAQPILAQVLHEFPHQVRLIHKHLPLAIHEHARDAALAAEAARDQGRFWEMHDRLYRDPNALDRAGLKAAARTLGLDMALFERSLDDDKAAQRIDRDLAIAQRAGVTRTPTIAVNGIVLSGYRLEPLRQAVRRALADSAASP
jgi:protein-disulfide isomerase